MVALAGIGRDFHLAKERVHLLGLEPPACTHGAMTGHGRGDVHKTAFERQRLVPFADVLGEVAHQTRTIDLAKERRRLAQSHRARAKGFEHHAVSRKLFRMSD